MASDFALAGLTEHYDESYLLMAKMFGWPIKNYPSVNVAKWKPRQNEIPSRTLRLIEKTNALDMELYEYASRLFAEKVERMDIHHEMRVLEERRRSGYLRLHDAASQYFKLKMRKWAPAWMPIASQGLTGKCRN